MIFDKEKFDSKITLNNNLFLEENLIYSCFTKKYYGTIK